MEYKDYYRILGVKKDASAQEIKRAYRRLARRYHPDVNPGGKAAEERFKEINEAHEVLSDPEKRAKYDRLGAQWYRWRQAGGTPEGFDWSGWSTGQPGGGRVWTSYGNLGDIFGRGGFSEFFRQMFGGEPTGPWQEAVSPRSSDMAHAVEVTLEEAAQGTIRIIRVGKRRLEVKIPPGVRAGSRVRIALNGAQGIGGTPKGDLYLKIEVLPHPVFERKGDDLSQEVEVDLYTAILGGEVKIPTITGGSVLLTIPAETQNGRTFRLQGQGMPSLSPPERRGDLYVKVKVALPRRLSRKEQELFRELASIR